MLTYFFSEIRTSRAWDMQITCFRNLLLVAFFFRWWTCTWTFINISNKMSSHSIGLQNFNNNNLLPPSFTNFLLRTNQVHSYNTRGSNKFYIPFCQTNIRKFSIIYQGPVLFNKLCSDIRNSLSLYSFQSKIKHYFFVTLLIWW